MQDIQVSGTWIQFSANICQNCTTVGSFWVQAQARHISNLYSRATSKLSRVSWVWLPYLRGEEGPAVGGGAGAAACAVAVVRHRPLQAPFGTARCRFSWVIFYKRKQKKPWIIHTNMLVLYPQFLYTVTHHTALSFMWIQQVNIGLCAQLCIQESFQNDSLQYVDDSYINCCQRGNNYAITLQF